jgi:hypothetical protein
MLVAQLDAHNLLAGTGFRKAALSHCAQHSGSEINHFPARGLSQKAHGGALASTAKP